MTLFSRICILGCTFIFLLSGNPQSAHGQSIWLQDADPPSIGIEILKTKFDAFDDVSFTTSLIYLSTRLPFSEQFVLVGELPIAHGDFTVPGFFLPTGTVVANPYLGVEMMLEDSPLSLEFGFRPNLIQDDKLAPQIVGQNTDVDRIEAFLPQLVTFLARAHYRANLNPNWNIRLTGGPTLWLFTNDQIQENTEWWINYSGQIGYENHKFMIFGGLTGRFQVSESGSFDKRSIHQLGIAAGLKFRFVRPGIHFRVPIDDTLNNIIDYVIGLSLNVQLF